MFDKPLTLESAFGGLSAIYARANALTTIGGRGERFAFLGLACADLARCIRKEQRNLYPVALAQAFAWYISLVEELFRDSGSIVLARGMCEKYPQGKCGYCQQYPCECGEAIRGEHVPGPMVLRQMELWSLEQWQHHLSGVYGQANRSGGVSRALNRMFEEVGEIGRLLYLADSVDEDLHVMSQKMARELADVLAWLFAISSLLSISLEKAVYNLYGNGCPVCEEAPCRCKNFSSLPGAGGVTHRFMSAEEVVQCRSA